MFSYLLLLVFLFIVPLSSKPITGSRCEIDYDSVLESLTYNVKVVCRSDRDTIQYAKKFVNNSCCVFNKNTCENTKEVFEYYFVRRDSYSANNGLCYYAFLVLFYTLCDCPSITGKTPGNKPATIPPAQTTNRTCGLSRYYSPRIIGGQTASECEFPWMARFTIGSRECGAVLVDTRRLLTAAHCVDGGNLTQMSISLGSVDADEHFFVSKVMRVNAHPLFFNKMTADYNDIAVLTLSKEVKFSNCIRPVCLPIGSHDITNYTNCYTAGWGITEYRKNIEGERFLRKLRVPILSESICRKYIRDYKPSILCGGYISGGKDTCSGDSGGPLMCPERGQWVLAGITSFGDGCALRNHPGAYTNVKYHLGWILNYVQA